MKKAHARVGKLNLRPEVIRTLRGVELSHAAGGVIQSGAPCSGDNTMKSDCCSVFDLCG